MDRGKETLEKHMMIFDVITWNCHAATLQSMTASIHFVSRKVLVKSNSMT
jgi:hypothetical protein